MHMVQRGKVYAWGEAREDIDATRLAHALLLVAQELAERQVPLGMARGTTGEDELEEVRPDAQPDG